MFILASNPLIESYFQSDLFGKGIFLSLLVLSLMTWTLLVRRWLSNREINSQGALIYERFQKRRSNPLTLDFALTQHPFSAVYKSLKLQAVELLNKNRGVFKNEEKVYLSEADINLIDAAMATTISHEVKGMEKSLFLLSTIVSLAPFLGLLGTVWGILLTFASLQGGAAGGHASVMNGLAMALGTTVAGLLVAIPALIGYNILRSSIAHFTVDVEDFSQLLLTSVEMHYRKVE